MASSLRLHRNLALAAAASFLVGASSVTCGGGSNTTNSAGTFTGGGGGSTTTGNATGGSASSATMSGGTGGDLTIDVQTKDYSAEDFFNTDPPPMTCDGGGMAPVVTGTPECPSDKNLPGCPCQMAGQTAACWTGFRKNRDHGNCHDGTTTCLPSGETSMLGWGPCTGETLPTGTTGKAACECFSAGHWAIANLSPCFYTSDDGMGNVTSGAISTLSSTMQCPMAFDAAPSESWSTDTLKVDCSGSFNLCYTIKAGDGKNPKPTDCVVAKVCSASYYTTANQLQMWPDLPGWISDPSASACVDQFTASGGYGQMSVDGQSDECEMVNKVFQTVTYCPLSCNGSDAGACGGCQAGGGGTF